MFQEIFRAVVTFATRTGAEYGRWKDFFLKFDEPTLKGFTTELLQAEVQVIYLLLKPLELTHSAAWRPKY
jgi:hypothetical protein